MDLLQILFQLLKTDKLGDLLTLFGKNFDLSALSNILQNLFNKNQSPTEEVGQSYYLSPISNIADKDIIFALNKYFSV